MDSDEKLDILIRFIADTQGAQAAQDALGSINTELNTLSPKTQEYIKSLNASKQAGEGLEVSHRALRTGLRLLGNEAAEAGHLLVTAMADPATAAFIAAAVSAQLLLQWLQKLGTVSPAPDLKPIFDMQNAMRDAAAQAEKFWQSLQPPNETEKAVNEQIGQAKAEADATKTSLDAKLKAQSQVIDAQVAAGKLDKDAAADTKRRLQEQTDLEKQHADELERKAEKQIKQAAVSAAPSKESVESARTENVKRQQELKESQSNLDSMQQNYQKLSDFYHSNIGSKDFRIHGEVLRAGLELERIKPQLEQAQATVAERQRRAQEAEQDLANKQAAVKTAQKYAQDIDTQTRLGGISDKAAAEAASIRAGTPAAIAAATQGISPARADWFGHVIAGESAVGMGKTMSDDQQRATAAFVAFARQHGMSQAQIRQLLESLQSKAEADNAKFAAMDAAIKSLTNQVRSSLNQPR